MLSPMTLSGPSARDDTAHTFVTWSMMTIATTVSATHQPRPGTRASALSAPFATGLALDALLGPRDHLEPADRDPVAARHTDAVRTQRDALERAVDLVDRLAGGGRQREIAF